MFRCLSVDLDDHTLQCAGMVDDRLRVLSLCTGNVCRSQMAEVWCQHLKGDVIQACSVGIETHGLNP